MTRSMRIVFLSVALVWSSMACAPKRLGPTMPSGYFFSLHTYDSQIWLLLQGSLLAERLPPVAELIVQVQDAQGRPVDGVAVGFELEPAWAQSASITPQQSSTRGGMVRAILEPKTTGVIRVKARVENVAQEVVITVSNPGDTGRSGAN